MTLQSELQNPLYKHWLKGGFSVKLFRKGVEKFIDESIKTLQSDFLSDICNHLSLPEVKCTECTTANCLPCLPDRTTTNFCYITGKGKHRQCSYHDKYDNQKKYRPCPNRICEPGLREKIQSEHNNNKPTWKYTDATKWCTAHWEIAKCFMTSGDATTESAAETDYSGLLHIIINCTSVFYKFTGTLQGHFAQLLQFRNDLFHNALFSLDKEKLDRHIDLMIEVLQDQVLAQEPDTQNAVDLLRQLKSGTLSISTKDESEILAEQKAEYQARKLQLQTSLCDIYEDNFKFIPISPLLDEVEANIDDVYEELIVCDPEIYDPLDSQESLSFDEFSMFKKAKISKKYKGIFLKDNISCKNMYVIGEAGMGKTTWCLRMLRTWIKAKKIQADSLTGADNLSVDEKSISEFDIVLFVSLRHAVNDGNIRDMIRNQLYQERPNLDSITSEVLKNEASKCLVILDGFDEWSPPDNFISTSTLQNAQVPGRQDLYGCPVLTTTRSYKLHQVRLQERDMDHIAKIQGIRYHEHYANRVIGKKREEFKDDQQYDNLTYPEFRKEVERSFNTRINNISFLRLPMVLLFMLCSWLDNGHLETTWAGNFSGVLECMILAAEKDGFSKRRGRLHGMKDLEKLKNEWSKQKSLLPRLFQDRKEACIKYSQLILNLAKLAFYTLFDPNIKSRLLFTEMVAKKWLSIKELEVAVKIGILSQIKGVSKTLTRTSNLSFLHKTIQEHLAAVHLCSNTNDHVAALKLFKDCCSSEDKIIEYEQILINIYGMEIQVASEVSKHIAKNMVSLETIDKFKLFAKEMESGHDPVTIFSLCPIYVAGLSNISKQTLKLEIRKTPLRCQKVLDTCKGSLAPETLQDIQETQSWLPNQWTSGENSSKLIALLAGPENNEEINTVNMSHCRNLETVNFTDMCYCDIHLPQTRLQKITIEGVNNCSFFIYNSVETSGIQQQPVKRIKLEKNTSDLQQQQIKGIKLVKTNNCTITLSESIWKIDYLELVNCNSCKFVIQADKFRSQLQVVSEIDHLCLKGSELQNIQIEKEDFQITINHLDLKILDLQNIEKSFERFLQMYLSNVKVVSCLLTDTVENWKIMQAAIPYMQRLEKLSLIVKLQPEKIYNNHVIDIFEFGDIPSSVICSLKHARGLKELEVINASAVTCNALAKTLPSMTQLEKITLSYSSWVEAFEHNHEIDLSDTPSSAVVDAIKWLPFLTDLTIYDNTGVTLTTLPMVLPHLRNLRKLKLVCKNMEFLEYVKSINEVPLNRPYLPPLPQLETLTLKGCRGDGLPGHLSALSNLPNIRHLHLFRVCQTDVEQLKQVLPKLTYLEILELNNYSCRIHMYIKDVDVKTFVGSLPKTNHTIKVIFNNIHLENLTRSRFPYKLCYVNETYRYTVIKLLPIKKRKVLQRKCKST